MNLPDPYRLPCVAAALECPALRRIEASFKVTELSQIELPRMQAASPWPGRIRKDWTDQRYGFSSAARASRRWRFTTQRTSTVSACERAPETQVPVGEGRRLMSFSRTRTKSGVARAPNPNHPPIKHPPFWGQCALSARGLS